MAVDSYRDLRVWQLGFEIAESLYKITSQFPKHEIYSLASQMQRAAVSIPSNIAEGHGRGATKVYLQHLSIANGSRCELETQLLLCQKLGYCDETTVALLHSRLEGLGRGLRALQRSLRAQLKRL